MSRRRPLPPSRCSLCGAERARKPLVTVRHERYCVGHFSLRAPRVRIERDGRRWIVVPLP